VATVNTYAPVLFVASLLLAAPPASAEDPVSYRLELVVFKRLTDTGTEEVVLMDDRLPGNAVSGDAGLPGSEPGISGHSLRDTRLTGNGQPPSDIGLPLGEPVAGEPKTEPATVTALAEAAERLASSRGYRVIHADAWVQPGLPQEATPGVSMAADGLVGEARLYRQRFLHLGLDLVFEDGQRLTQWRRMRSNEVHYYDHPRYGVIAIAVPVTEGS
jgi:hypothetical protein